MKSEGREGRKYRVKDDQRLQSREGCHIEVLDNSTPLNFNQNNSKRQERQGESRRYGREKDNMREKTGRESVWVSERE
jgi:hypothetical protein